MCNIILSSHLMSHISFLIILLPTIYTLFPYTTLFRSIIRNPIFCQKLVKGYAFDFDGMALHSVSAGRNGMKCHPIDRKSTRLNSSHSDLVCRLLLEKKKKEKKTYKLI